jgi:high-affinity iron transporter
MFQTSIIVFREILEVALVIGILAAATSGVRNRSWWIICGVILGIFGSVIIAFFADNISESLQGRGQEAFNATILLIAALMISWTLIWMKKHAKEISGSLKKLGKSVIDGEKSVTAILTVITLSTLREGTETVLFSYGLYSSGTSLYEIIYGAGVGLLAGIIAGFGIYYGLLKTGKYFFAVTSWMLILLTAGMVSNAFGFLVSGDFVPALKYPIWNSSFLISDDSIPGLILHMLTGYISKPSGIQILAYLSTLGLLLIGFNFDRFFSNKK